MVDRGTGRGPAGREARRPGRSRATGRPTRPARPPQSARGAASRPSVSRPATARSAPTREVRDPGGERPTPLWRGLLPDAAGNRRIFRVVVLVSIVGFLAVLLVPTARAYLGQRQQISSLRQQVAAQERSVAALRAEKARWQDPAYIEQQARQRLKFVKVGETSYTVIDAEPKQPDVPVLEAASGVPDDLPWYDAVWTSVRAADVPSASAP